MDPKNQLSGLDPKLKEAYERVMGATIPPASPKPSGGEPASPPPVPPQEPAASAPTSQTEPVPPANQPSEPVQQPPPVQEPTQQPPPPPVAPPEPPEPPPIPPPVEPPAAQNKPASSPPQPTGFVANAPKKEKRGGLKISPPILMAVGVAFLLLYIFFWIRVFNLSLF